MKAIIHNRHMLRPARPTLTATILTVLWVFLSATGNLNAQTSTVADLQATGTNIKWYLTPTGGSPLSTSTLLVNGQHYYASQTVGGVESLNRLEVVANLAPQVAPTAGTHVPSQTQVVWNWNAASGASGYKWNTTADYGSATNMATATTTTETGLTCNTSYTRYVWSYNASGCVSSATSLTQSTSSCITAPAVSTNAATAIGTATATLNGSITATGGQYATVRGFKYSTTNGFNPASSGTNISESGTFGVSSFSANLSGLLQNTTYYVVAYATNTIGTSYGSQVSFTTQIQTEFSYTGGVQTFVVPSGVTSLVIEAWGAQGGKSGGNGAYVTATRSVTPGQTLYLYVGGQGSSGSSVAGGWPGGGQAGYGYGNEGSGGGYTAVDSWMIAAGGGGAGGWSGGAGGEGGFNGAPGTAGQGGGGGGGTQSSSGGGGYPNGTGSWGLSGSGSSGGTGGSGSAAGGGGGGGGYYGGGGGGGDSDACCADGGGGGGGSSLVPAGGTYTNGSRSGNGYIRITF